MVPYTGGDGLDDVIADDKILGNFYISWQRIETKYLPRYNSKIKWSNQVLQSKSLGLLSVAAALHE